MMDMRSRNYMLRETQRLALRSAGPNTCCITAIFMGYSKFE